MLSWKASHCLPTPLIRLQLHSNWQEDPRPHLTVCFLEFPEEALQLALCSLHFTCHRQHSLGDSKQWKSASAASCFFWQLNLLCLLKHGSASGRRAWSPASVIADGALWLRLLAVNPCPNWSMEAKVHLYSKPARVKSEKNNKKRLELSVLTCVHQREIGCSVIQADSICRMMKQEV